MRANQTSLLSEESVDSLDNLTNPATLAKNKCKAYLLVNYLSTTERSMSSYRRKIKPQHIEHQ